mmetsp:Transcript_234/g.433  ORF Transcript_234/g.433 Transcript_234/m.433 type:complete len:128 (-) Transcript_234:563-946(-)|eukprot:CAMPEP_0202890324 /NCGR_PEP_ID=MMETSP1392-20130828/773_1 /ASSEMBLY_ACC=CAM_ASM_000868 /TAXON_ID=225041 /ORGANISM="Chlamydomonas chlamydogama, Strain SAG 11-48b" /LENGTH=127 /DNA_ID=CAMNT_0049573873 /DNA_START=41 /DNA_END=424 /DNA_ORIENTATION=-
MAQLCLALTFANPGVNQILARPAVVNQPAPGAESALDADGDYHAAKKLNLGYGTTVVTKAEVASAYVRKTKIASAVCGISEFTAEDRNTLNELKASLDELKASQDEMKALYRKLDVKLDNQQVLSSL